MWKIEKSKVVFNALLWYNEQINGYQKRYGIVYVNRDDNDLKDLAKIPKDSFYWYQKVIETNGASCL